MSVFDFSMDLPFHNEWSNIEILRTSVQNCLATLFRDVEGCQTIAMVTSELLENAVKYGYWSGQDSRFRLRIWGNQEAAHVCVQNPVKPEGNDAATLMSILQSIKSYPTAEEAYCAKLLEVAARPRDSHSSGLGLARIAYEGGCALSAEFAEQILSVTADIPIEAI